MDTDTVSRRQLNSVGLCAILSPAIRTLPALAVPFADEHAWISALIAAPLLAGFYVLMARLAKKAGAPLAGSAARRLGAAGKALLIVEAAWLVFYAAFIMRTAANRFISTIFPESTPLSYIPAMGAFALMTGLGRFRVLGRLSEIAKPMLIGVMLLTLLLALPEVSLMTFSRPVAGDWAGILLGVLPFLGAGSVAVYASLCSRDGSGLGAGGAALCSGLLSLLCFTSVGCFGPVLTREINNPYFVMIRNLRMFDAIERVEALVIAIWFFADFVLVALLMHAAGASLSSALGVGIDRSRGRALRLGGGRWIVWLCAIASSVLAGVLAPSSAELSALSMRYVPLLSPIFTFGLVPALGALCARKCKKPESGS